MLREEWLQPKQAKESVISYLTGVYDKLQLARDLALQTEEDCKGKMKAAYDVGSRTRCFSVDNLVLVLLPSDTNKLQTQWQGPFPITDKLGETTYRVRMGPGSRGERTFHVNLLAQWDSPSAVCLFNQTVDDEDFPSWSNPRAPNETMLDDHLQEPQRLQLLELLEEFGDTSVMSQDTPRRRPCPSTPETPPR